MDEATDLKLKLAEAKIERLEAQLNMTMSCLNIAVREMAQASRCLGLAILYQNRSDPDNMFAQLEDLNKHLAEGTDYLNQMMGSKAPGVGNE